MIGLINLKSKILSYLENNDERKHYDLELALAKELSKNESIVIAFEMLNDDKQGFINKAKVEKFLYKQGFVLAR